MCAQVEIVLWTVKMFYIFIEMKKEKKSQLSLFSIFFHKLYYFVNNIWQLALVFY